MQERLTSTEQLPNSSPEYGSMSSKFPSAKVPTSPVSGHSRAYSGHSGAGSGRASGPGSGRASGPGSGRASGPGSGRASGPGSHYASGPGSGRASTVVTAVPQSYNRRMGATHV